jgi:hypothetical protein
MVERGLPLFIFVVAGLYLTQSMKLPFGTTGRPGAGFYPTAVAIFACIVALVATVKAFRTPLPGRVATIEDPEAPARRRRVFATVLALLAFCFVLPYIGYPVAALAFVTAMLLGLGARWPMAVCIGVLSAAGSHYVFASLLDVPLPRGPW